MFAKCKYTQSKQLITIKLIGYKKNGDTKLGRDRLHKYIL